MAGLVLDDWEEFYLSHSLGERADGKWAAFECGLTVPRQNGKGAILEARQLAGLFLLGERLIVHSAHQFDTSLEAFDRLQNLIEARDDLSRRVKTISRAHGKEGITLTNGQRIRFRTRTKGGGRGFSADCLILDEAMIIPEAALGALLPTLSARENPQVWYTGSAVDQEVHEDGVVFARIRERGIKGDDPNLLYAEWSLPAASPDDVSEELATDSESWAQANPALGIRIPPETVANEQRSMSRRTFAVERLGVGDWPRVDGMEDQGIDSALWAKLQDLHSIPQDPLWFAFDVTPKRSAATIAVAGSRDDGLLHVEIVDHRSGTGWLPARLSELVARHEASGIVADGGGPAAAIIPHLENAGLTVEVIGAKEQSQACGRFYDIVEQGGLRHLATAELQAAIKGAKTRALGDAWAWSRKASNADISPLVAATMALWKVETAAPQRTNSYAFL